MAAALVGREEETPMSRKMLRVFAVLVLAILTANGAAHASGRNISGGETPVLAAAWEWIAGWLRSMPGLSMMRTAGPEMDPNGLKTDEGSSMDPNGGIVLPDEGSSMDPNGHT
jgi:hypothetical protein